jgi:hypothetical protein
MAKIIPFPRSTVTATDKLTTGPANQLPEFLEFVCDLAALGAQARNLWAKYQGMIDKRGIKESIMDEMFSYATKHLKPTEAYDACITMLATAQAELFDIEDAPGDCQLAIHDYLARHGQPPAEYVEYSLKKINGE